MVTSCDYFAVQPSPSLWKQYSESEANWLEEIWKGERNLPVPRQSAIEEVGGVLSQKTQEKKPAKGGSLFLIYYQHLSIPILAILAFSRNGQSCRTINIPY